VLCGGHNLVWDSCGFSDAIMARLDAHHDTFPHAELRYPEAGHYVGAAECCYNALPLALVPYGSTVLANAQASEQAHAELLAYLAQLTVG
jgi:hypothetical protein